MHCRYALAVRDVCIDAAGQSVADNVANMAILFYSMSMPAAMYAVRYSFRVAHAMHEGSIAWN